MATVDVATGCVELFGAVGAVHANKLANTIAANVLANIPASS
jgi:hypothetical protein